MTTLLTGLNTTVRGCFCAINGRLYFTNGFDRVQVMTPDVDYNAGITGPTGVIGAPSATAAGNTTNGTHLIRYRYRDSRTGYVSNPSNAASVTVSGGNGQLTYNIGGPITASADAKADTIIVELTAVNGGAYYVAATASNAAASVVVSITDANLTQQTNAAIYGSAETFDLFGNEAPPSWAVMIAHRGRSIVGVDQPYVISGAFVNATNTINGTGYSTQWVGRLVQASGDTASYEISAATTTVLTLTAVYAGTTATKSATVYAKLPNRIYYSRAGFPESFFVSMFARDVLQGRGDRLVAMYSRRDAAYLLGKYSTDRLVFTTDPSAVSSSLLPVQAMRGVFNQRCLVEADGEVYAWDRQGIYRLGESPVHMSNDVDALLRSYVNYSYVVQFHGAFEPVDRILSWWFVKQGDTVPKYAVCLELDSGRWSFGRWRQGITSSAVIPSSDGQVRAWVGDENGYLWAWGMDASFDGVPPTCPAVVTVNAGATATVIPVVETLTTSPDVAGASLYFPLTGEVGIVQSNTASQITMTSALSMTPPLSVELWLGTIPFEYRTKWFTAQGGMATKKRPVYFGVSVFAGSSTGKLRVYFYVDQGETPVALSADGYSSYPDGVSINVAGSYVEIDLDGGSGDGFVSCPVPATWERTIQARLISDKPDGELRIVDATFLVMNGGERPVLGE